MIQVIYFVLRQYVRTAPKGPLPEWIKLLLISIPPSIPSSQGDARIAQVSTALWVWWWYRGVPLPVGSYLWEHSTTKAICHMFLLFFKIVYSWQWLKHCEVFYFSPLCPKQAFLLPLLLFQYLDHRIPFNCSCWNWLDFYDTDCWSYSIFMLILQFILAQK